MALVEFRVHWNSIDLPENVTLTVGEQWKVWLDQQYFEEDVSKFIIAEYVEELDTSEFASCKDTVRIFKLQIDRVNIPDLKTKISPCEIQDVALYTEEDRLRGLLEEEDQSLIEASQLILSSTSDAIAAAAASEASADAIAETIPTAIRNEQDLIAAEAAGEKNAILTDSIQITQEVTFSGTLERANGNHRIIQNGGYLMLSGRMVDRAKGNKLFEFAEKGQLRFYAPTNLNGNMEASGQLGPFAFQTPYIRPFVSGEFNNSTRELYMFGGAPSDLIDWYDAWMAAYASLPSSAGHPSDSIERSGVMVLDDGPYGLRSTIYLSRETRMRGIGRLFNFTRFSALSGFSDELPNPRSNGKNFLLNCYSASGIHNSDFGRDVGEIAFNCNEVADGIRISGAEHTSYDRIVVRDIKPGSDGVTFAKGTCNTVLQNFAVRNEFTNDGSKKMRHAYHFEGSTNNVTIINGKANNALKAVGFDLSGIFSHNLRFLNTGFEHVAKLIDENWTGGGTSTQNEGEVSFVNCFLDSDTTDGIVARWNGQHKCRLLWTGRLYASTTTEPVIEFFNTNYNMIGVEGATPRVYINRYFDVSFNSSSVNFVRKNVNTTMSGELSLPSNSAILEPSGDAALTLNLLKKVSGKTFLAKSLVTSYSSTPSDITVTLPDGSLPASTLLILEIVISGSRSASTENYWFRRYTGAIRSFSTPNQIRQSEFDLAETVGGSRGTGASSPTISITGTDFTPNIVTNISAGGDAGVKAQVEVYLITQIT